MISDDQHDIGEEVRRAGAIAQHERVVPAVLKAIAQAAHDDETCHCKACRAIDDAYANAQAVLAALAPAERSA
jgi:hypothetical protein